MMVIRIIVIREAGYFPLSALYRALLLLTSTISLMLQNVNMITGMNAPRTAQVTLYACLKLCS